MKNKCETCGREIDTTNLPGGRYWCGKPCKMPIPEGAITNPAEIMKALSDDPKFEVGYESPYPNI